MKTYWLVKHEHRPPILGMVTEEDQFFENHIEPDQPSQNTSNEPILDEKDKRIYSPITFHNVRTRFSVFETTTTKVKGKK